jgi:predicted ATPase
MSRLDRLVTAKAVAQYASVVGRQFSYELLQVVSQLDEMTLQRELRRLVEAELVYQRGLPPQTTYAFKHALIQDAAYASLLKSTRQQYHQRIAQVLETQFPETVEHQPELLAHHCTEAGLYEQAIEYWRKAGEQAVQRFAYMEGIAHLTKGLEHLRALSDTPERIQQELALLNTLGPALMAMKGHAAPEVESTYARARVLCRQVEDSPQLFTVLIGLRLFYMTRGELQTACEVGEHLLQVAQRQHDTSLLVEAHRALGHNMLTLGELQLARSYMEQGMALYDPYQHHSHAFLYGQDPAVACRGMVAFTLWLLGCPDQALQRSEEALTLAQELAHPYSVAFASIGVATLSLFRRAPHKTRERAETAMAYCAEQGFAQYLSNATILYGWALSMQGRAEEGIVKIASFGRTIPVDRRTPSSHGNMSGTQA